MQVTTFIFVFLLTNYQSYLEYKKARSTFLAEASVLFEMIPNEAIGPYVRKWHTMVVCSFHKNTIRKSLKTIFIY